MKGYYQDPSKRGSRFFYFPHISENIDFSVPTEFVEKRLEKLAPENESPGKGVCYSRMWKYRGGKSRGSLNKYYRISCLFPPNQL